MIFKRILRFTFIMENILLLKERPFERRQEDVFVPGNYFNLLHDPVFSLAFKFTLSRIFDSGKNRS